MAAPIYNPVSFNIISLYFYERCHYVPLSAYSQGQLEQYNPKMYNVDYVNTILCCVENYHWPF